MITFDNGCVVVGNDDIFSAHDGRDGGAFRQINVFHLPAHDPRTPLVAQCHRFNGFGSAAPQGMHPHHISAADVRKQCTDGDLLR